MTEYVAGVLKKYSTSETEIILKYIFFSENISKNFSKKLEVKVLGGSLF